MILLNPHWQHSKKDRATISPILRDALVNISDEKLHSTFEMEGMKMSHFDLIAFITYREANCSGQIALCRRLQRSDEI